MDGIITEDSDVFLFGGQAVYKNVFRQSESVEVYLARDALKELGLTREHFVALAFLLGSDYTEGVKGVGIVNSMEILQAFPPTNPGPNAEKEIRHAGALEGLCRFKEWLDGYDFKDTVLEMRCKEEKKKARAKKKANKVKKDARKRKVRDGDLSEVEEEEEEDDEEAGEKEQYEEDEEKKEGTDSALAEFVAKHKSARAKWMVPRSFPEKAVADAYLYPSANMDDAEFSWTVPKIHRVRAWVTAKLGWTDAEVDAKITPVIMKFANRNPQTRIDSFFVTYEDKSMAAKIDSQRLKRSVEQAVGAPTHQQVEGKTIAIPARAKAGKARKKHKVR